MKTKKPAVKCYCISFRRAARALTSYYDRMLLPAGITINQYSLLVNLFKTAPCSATALAGTMKLERTTLIRNIKPLVDAGLIQDLPEGNRRDRRLVITKAGLKTLETARKLWKKAQTGVKKHIGEEKLEKLIDTIAGLEQMGKPMSRQPPLQ